ncbi:MAG TPA: methyltransferase regulatory domain-containing protein [Rhodopila sp.]
MATWDDGYVTDVVYTHASYREMTPLWLATTALLLGHRPPDLSRPFRYADLGCGHGLTATIVAATCPHAEVWGFDFNPAHIENARRLAEAAGLANLHFKEASFAELAERPPLDPGSFDFVVSHGVASWISVENRGCLTGLIGQWLRPGGLAYLSYNVATGWASMQPVRALMLMLMRSRQERSDQAAAGLMDYLETLKEAKAGFLTANPIAGQRLTEIRKHDPRYLAHEFLNADWHPLMFADVAAAMQDAKCSYIGSATLTENLDAVSLPPGMTALVTEATDPVLRETLRDFGLAKGFRRDVFRRGLLPVPVPEQVRLIDGIELVWSGRQPEDPIKLTTPIGEVQGIPEIYTPMMARLMAGNCTVGEIRQDPALARRPVTDVLQAVVLLIAGGYAQPALPEAVQVLGRASVARLNAAIGEVNADGGNIALLAGATTGSEVAADPLETLLVREKLSGRPMEIDGLTDRVLAALTRAGRSVQRDGKPITDFAESRAMVRGSLVGIIGQRLSVLARLGAVPA